MHEEGPDGLRRKGRDDKRKKRGVGGEIRWVERRRNEMKVWRRKRGGGKN